MDDTGIVVITKAFSCCREIRFDGFSSPSSFSTPLMGFILGLAFGLILGLALGLAFGEGGSGDGDLMAPRRCPIGLEIASREKTLLITLPNTLSSVFFFLAKPPGGLADFFPRKGLADFFPSLSTGDGVSSGCRRRLPLRLGGVALSASETTAFFTLTPEGRGAFAREVTLLLGTASSSSSAPSTGGAALLEGPTSSAAPASTTSLKEAGGFLAAGAGLQSLVRKKSCCASGSRAMDSPTAPRVCRRPLGDLGCCPGEPTEEPDGVDMATGMGNQLA
mmetsp:Transcript_9654/g.17363  ORF Transcript_9654/g.17363 Transcript_9654/m.17363 type:complete len:277 (-) Transcript_9654:33-863(-)